LLPGEPLPACWRIRLLDIEEKHDEAVKEYRDLIRAQPGFLLARTLLADSLHSHQQADEAVQLLEESLSVAKPDQAAWIQLRLGAFQEELGRLDQAIAGYRAAMPLPACAVQACNNLAWLYATRRNDPDSALPLARQAAKLAGNDPAILDTLGWVLYLKGENDEALQTLSKAKSGLPDLPTVRYHLGMALLKAGRSAEARTELQEALAISKDFPEAVDAAAKLHGI
jgi:tetratricopeptide (TPR) repeat protein